jgi:hypothetical protein
MAETGTRTHTHTPVALNLGAYDRLWKARTQEAFSLASSFFILASSFFI